MSKADLRRNGRSGLDTVNAGDANAQVVDEAIYGSLGQLETGRLVAKPISIHEILPDPKQPRRLLPGALRYDRPAGEILLDWADMAAQEVGHAIAVVHLLRGEETERIQEDDDRDPGHIEKEFMRLVNLAATIRRDGGLINPITVYRVGNGFQIETGERRWLAHHLLQAALGEAQWHRISAREVVAPSIWRQAHENTARADLNAISLARQLALLVMDIYQEKGVTFEPYEHFSCDRHFYAQVADGFQFPVAYGDRERIIAAMGKSNVSQVNQFRALLRLPDNEWQTADQENWGEKPLREFMKTLRHDVPAPIIEQESESITPVRDHSSVQAQDSDEADSDGQATEATDANALPAHVEKLLFWAYQRAAAALSEAGTWFSADNVTRSVDRLNQLIEHGLLEGRRPVPNQLSNTAYYRISSAGCEAIGEQALVYVYGTPPNHLPPGADQPAMNGAQSRPVSGGEFHAGTGETKKRSAPAHPLLQGSDRLVVQTALSATTARLDTADGLNEAIHTFQRSIAAQQRILDELLLRKRA